MKETQNAFLTGLSHKGSLQGGVKVRVSQSGLGKNELRALQRRSGNKNLQNETVSE